MTELEKAYGVLNDVQSKLSALHLPVSDDISPQLAAAIGRATGMALGAIASAKRLVAHGVDNDPALDPYHYARDHDAGPGAWCVYGPNGFKMTTPQLDKSVAYAIGKLLSGQIQDAKRMVDELAT